HVTLHDAELACGVRGDLDPRVPHRLRHRVRRFLEPRADGAAPVVEPERWIGEQGEAAAVALELGRRGFGAADLDGDRYRRDIAEDSATPERAFELSLNQIGPSRFQILLKRRPRNSPLPFLD